ncbi:cyclase [Bacillaceae bacterium JMAK1]|nr:cyclase [Bacillaceae bacterium JMAK1]
MKVIDLSQTMHDGMDVYPGDPEVSIDTVCTLSEDQYVVRQVSMGSHTGTHVDAFSHMHEDGLTLSEIPLQQFLGQAVRVDLRRPFPEKTGLIFAEFVDIDQYEQIVKACPPFVGGDISEALERALLKRQIVTYTNLVSLERLPELEPFLFVGLPLKIKDGDGSPVRAVAVFLS